MKCVVKRKEGEEGVMIDEESPECGVVIVCGDMQQREKAAEQKRGQCNDTQTLEKTTIKRIGWEKGGGRKDSAFVVSGKSIENPDTALTRDTTQGSVRRGKLSWGSRGVGARAIWYMIAYAYLVEEIAWKMRQSCRPSLNDPRRVSAEPSHQIPKRAGAIGRKTLSAHLHGIETRPGRAIIVSRATWDVVLGIAQVHHQHESDSRSASAEDHVREHTRATGFATVNVRVIDVVEPSLPLRRRRAGRDRRRGSG